MDAFYEEDERIVGHAADSYHRIDIRQTSRHLVVRSDLQPPITAQPILEAFMREGYFASHVRRMRTCYYERQLSLIDAIHKQLSSILTVAADSAGMHLLAHLTPDARKKFTDREASQRAAAHHVIAPALSDFYTDQRDGGALVLGYAAVPERALIQAVQRMARAFEG
jgi:GntR family transcriptional regulator/MocR family aminotransferase